MRKQQGRDRLRPKLRARYDHVELLGQALLNMKQALQALKIEDEAIEDEAARYFAALDEAYDRIEFTPRRNGCGRARPMSLPIARVRLGWRRRIALLGRRGLKAIGLARSR